MPKLYEVRFSQDDDDRQSAIDLGGDLLDTLGHADKLTKFFRDIGLYDNFELQASKDNLSVDDLNSLGNVTESEHLVQELANLNLVDEESARELNKPVVAAEDKNGFLDSATIEAYSPDELISIFNMSEDEVAAIVGHYYANKQQRLQEVQAMPPAKKIAELRKDHHIQGPLSSILEVLDVDDKRRTETNQRAVGKYVLEAFADNTAELSVKPQQQLLETYKQVKDKPQQLESLKLLAGFYMQAYNMEQGDGIPYKKDTANFDYKPNQESLTLSINNINDSGLKFALNVHKASNGCQTLVLTNDESEMTVQQVQELAGFFFKSGLVKDAKTVELPPSLKIKGHPELNVQQIFGEAFLGQQEEQRKIEAQENTPQENAPQDKSTNAENQQNTADFCGTADGNASSSASDSNAFTTFDSYLSAGDLTPSMTSMRGSMNARAGIMGFRKKHLSWRRNLDGSMTLVCYLNEADQRTDAELDKKGIQSRKKSFAVKVKKGPPPLAWLYIEPGKEIKAAHAKMILGAFKTQGCKYFNPASTDIMGGAGNKAFWEASGDQLMCPKLKCSKNDDGFMLGNDHLQVILKAMKDKGDGDITETTQFKMRLVKELKGQLAYGESIKKPNSALRTATFMLEGEVLFSNFKSSCQGSLESYMREQADPNNSERWTTADLASAAYAMKEVLKAVETGKDKHGNPVGFDYLGRGDNSTALKMLLVKEMAENRPQIDKLVQSSYDAFKRDKPDEHDETTQGSALKRAGEEVLKNAKEDLNAFVSGYLEDSYGDNGKIQMHFPTGAILKENNISRPTPQQKGDKDYQAIYDAARKPSRPTLPVPPKKDRYYD